MSLKNNIFLIKQKLADKLDKLFDKVTEALVPDLLSEDPRSFDAQVTLCSTCDERQRFLSFIHRAFMALHDSEQELKGELFELLVAYGYFLKNDTPSAERKKWLN